MYTVYALENAVSKATRKFSHVFPIDAHSLYQEYMSATKRCPTPLHKPEESVVIMSVEGILAAVVCQYY